MKFEHLITPGQVRCRTDDLERERQRLGVIVVLPELAEADGPELLELLKVTTPILCFFHKGEGDQDQQDGGELTMPHAQPN